VVDGQELDWDAPLDLELRLAQAPRDVGVKGMFFRQVVDQVRSETGVVLAAERHTRFRDYPLGAWIELQARAAEAYPDMPRHRAIARLARPTFEKFRESVLGRVIFGAVGFERALELASRAYRRTSDVARCEVRRLDPGHAILELRNVWDFPSWSVGMFEGGLGAFGLDGSVHADVLSTCDVDLRLDWTPHA
jgi:uncharacterized protein (TIGR02265 family)